MGMNIKSEKAHRLARQLAASTGESMTAVVEQALEEKLLRIQNALDVQERLRRVDEILKRSGPTPPGVTSDHSGFYDDRGLPI